MKMLNFNVDEFWIAHDQEVKVSVSNLEDFGKTTPPPHGRYVIGIIHPDGSHSRVGVSSPKSLINYLTKNHMLKQFEAYEVLGAVVRFLKSKNRIQLIPEDESLAKLFLEQSTDFLREHAEKVSEKIHVAVSCKNIYLLCHRSTIM